MFAGRFRRIDSETFGFFQPSCFAVFPASPVFTKLSTRFDSACVIPTMNMLFSHVFFWRKPFKVIGMVVGFIAVLVMNMRTIFGIWNPANCNDSMHKSLSPNTQVIVIPLGGKVRTQLSKNFPAARDCVEMVKKSIFDTVHFKADHAGVLQCDREFLLPSTRKGMQKCLILS